MSELNQDQSAKPSAEDIAQHYKSAMESVKLINGQKPTWESDEEWVATIARNKEHLKIMLAQDFWTTEDLEPLRQASA